MRTRKTPQFTTSTERTIEDTTTAIAEETTMTIEYPQTQQNAYFTTTQTAPLLAGNFVDAYQLVLPDAMRYASHLCRRIQSGSDLVRDVLQDATEVALRKSRELDDSSRFKPWFFGIVHYTFLGHARRRRQQQEIPFEEDEPHSIRLVLPAPRIMQIELCEALGQLGSEEREALELFAFIGLTLEELSQVFGCSVKQMQKRIERARQRLRRYLLEGDAPAGRPPEELDLTEELARVLALAMARLPDLRERVERRGRRSDNHQRNDSYGS